jgi:hypothetical protein
MRRGFNFFPAYRRTGARITYIDSDLHEVHIKLLLTWANNGVRLDYWHSNSKLILLKHGKEAEGNPRPFCFSVLT